MVSNKLISSVHLVLHGLLRASKRTRCCSRGMYPIASRMMITSLALLRPPHPFTTLFHILSFLFACFREVFPGIGSLCALPHCLLLRYYVLGAGFLYPVFSNFICAVFVPALRVFDPLPRIVVVASRTLCVEASGVANLMRGEETKGGGSMVPRCMRVPCCSRTTMFVIWPHVEKFTSIHY